MIYAVNKKNIIPYSILLFEILRYIVIVSFPLFLKYRTLVWYCIILTIQYSTI